MSKEWNGSDPLDKVQHLLSVVSVWIQKNFDNWFEWTRLTVHWCVGVFVLWGEYFYYIELSDPEENKQTTQIRVLFFVSDILKCLNKQFIYISLYIKYIYLIQSKLLFGER